MAVLPDFQAARFEPGAPIGNRFFPLDPGTIASYAGSGIDQDTGEVVHEHNDVFVTFETQEIAGVTTTVVRDTGYSDGVLIEDTVDRYAQDTHGNVWYLGELSYSFEYDDDGNFVGTSTEGSWQAGVDGAQPGHIMPADPGFGVGYFQEFAPGVAEDEGIVVGVDQKVSIGLGDFEGVLKTLDTTALEPDAAEFKHYAPGVGTVLEQDLDHEGEVVFSNELQGVRTVGGGANGEGAGNDGRDIPLGVLHEGQALDLHGVQEPAPGDFLANGAELDVTFLAGIASLHDAIGAYTFDAQTGEIGEGRILFPDTSELAAGTTATVEVAKGEGLGLFLVPDGADLGLDLSDFEDGGLSFTNFVSGAPATLGDGLAPLVSDTSGEILPITALHALDGDPADGLNFLNRTAGIQAVVLDAHGADDGTSAGKEVTVLGFEDLLNTDPNFDGDYNDAVVAVSDAPLGAGTVASLLGELGSEGSDSIIS